MCDFTIVVFKQKTAYEMRISDWSSDVCSSDLRSCRRPFRDPPDADVVEDVPEREHAFALTVARHEADLPRTSGAAAGPSAPGGEQGMEKLLQIGRASCRE